MFAGLLHVASYVYIICQLIKHPCSIFFVVQIVYRSVVFVICQQANLNQFLCTFLLCNN